MMKLFLAGRAIDATAVAKTEIHKCRRNQTGSQVAYDADRVCLAFGADSFVILEIGFNVKNLKRPAGKREKPSGTRINPVERYFCQGTWSNTPVFKKFIDLLICQHDIYCSQRLVLNLEFRSNASADVDHSGFFSEDTFDKTSHGNHWGNNRHDIGN